MTPLADRDGPLPVRLEAYISHAPLLSASCVRKTKWLPAYILQEGPVSPLQRLVLAHVGARRQPSVSL